jgi:hypothetical protein
MAEASTGMEDNVGVSVAVGVLECGIWGGEMARVGNGGVERKCRSGG